MGVYLNPGNNGFSKMISGTYVDKSGLIRLVNHTIDTPLSLTCISRPRRFGKSYAAKMLCAYYDKTCDSSALFRGLEIEKDRTFRDHLNKYDVIYLDMTAIIAAAGEGSIVSCVCKSVSEELERAYPEAKAADALYATLVNALAQTGNKFIMIMDEWDAPIRERVSQEREYLEFLRSLFKNSGVTDKVFAAVYMTGILPVKKDNSQSAISDFKEYTMIKPRIFGSYVGFTESEVRKLCHQYDCDFDTMKQWYDGYEFKDVGAVYNPNSVMEAIRNRDFDSYWTETSAASGLLEYMNRDEKGLSKVLTELIGGVSVPVNTSGFSNDLVNIRSKDDILTLLIHLGYLAYDSETESAYIPNEEIRLEFAKSIREVHNSETIKRVQESDRLIYDTVHMNEEAVARQIERIHLEETAPLNYNREEDLRAVIKLAYFSYKDNYLKLEELPSGAGYADIVYLPKKRSPLPALVIELKWNDSAEGAIDQIRRKNYPQVLEGYGGEILLVGISYARSAPSEDRRHVCKIEKYVVRETPE